MTLQLIGVKRPVENNLHVQTVCHQHTHNNHLTYRVQSRRRFTPNSIGVWGHKLIISVLRNPWQEDYEFKAHLSYLTRLSQRKEEKRKK